MGTRNRALIRALFEAADAGNLERVAELYAEDFVDHARGGSREGTDKAATLRTFRDLLAAFPDTEHTVEDIIAEGDRVAVRLLATGTHTGPFRGVQPTGKHVAMRSTAVYRVHAGRLAERWCDGVASVADVLAEASPGDAPPLVLRGAEGPWTETGAGGRFQHLALDVLSVTRFELEPGAYFEPHEHINAQITYVVEGELTFDVGGVAHVLGPGDAIAIPGGLPHAVRAGEKPVEALDAWAPPPTHLE